MKLNSYDEYALEKLKEEYRNKSSDIYDLLCKLEEINDLYQEQSEEFDNCLKKIEKVESLIEEILSGDYN